MNRRVWLEKSGDVILDLGKCRMEPLLAYPVGIFYAAINIKYIILLSVVSITANLKFLSNSNLPSIFLVESNCPTVLVHS